MKQWFKGAKYCKNWCWKGAKKALHSYAEQLLKGDYFQWYFPLRIFQTVGTEFGTGKILSLTSITLKVTFFSWYSEFFLSIIFIIKTAHSNIDCNKPPQAAYCGSEHELVQIRTILVKLFNKFSFKKQNPSH